MAANYGHAHKIRRTYDVRDTCTPSIRVLIDQFVELLAPFSLGWADVILARGTDIVN